MKKDTEAYLSLDRRIIWIFLAFIVVVVLGYVIGIASNSDIADRKDPEYSNTGTEGHDHSSGENSHDHAHDEYVNVTGALIPNVDFDLLKDSVGGWNVHIITENFTFAPENVNTPSKEGEGHAHIYVDGKKIARVYGEWFHVGNIDPGAREVRVTLNANSHEQYAFEGSPIESIKVIQIQ